MSATYPASVRQFSPRQDATMFILAAHVNDLQDEVAAIERTVGAIPVEWDNGNVTQQVYQSVKSRLDDIQNTILAIQGQITYLQSQVALIGPLTTRVTNDETNIVTLQNQVTAINGTINNINQTLISYGNRLTNLENITGAIPGQITNLQNQVNALRTGSAASILNTGQAITPHPYDYNVIRWNKAEYDNVGIFSGGTGLVCPQDGWWLINFYGIFPNTRGDGTGIQCEATMELRINGDGIVSDRKELELGIGGSFGFNAPYAGPLYRGSIVSGAVNFNPYNSNAPSFSGRISFTRMHSL